MSTETQNSVLEECQKALESCPHFEQGVVRVICRACRSEESIQAWDADNSVSVVIDCPRCLGPWRDGALELCPCVERFSKETIEQAIRSMVESDGEAGECDQEENDGSEEMEYKDQLPISEALRWQRPQAEPSIPVDAESAAEQLASLRAWAVEHREIRIPHPKAALILHLLDRNMIDVAIKRDMGKVVFHATGAKEEFRVFINGLNGAHQQDDITEEELMCFAYGIVDWELDPSRLEQYQRGNGRLEIHTRGYDLTLRDGQLHGEWEQIEAVLFDARLRRWQLFSA